MLKEDMLHLLYLYVLSFAFITNCSDSDDEWVAIDDDVQKIDRALTTSSDQWHDIDPDFEKDTKDTITSLIQARDIVKEMRTKHVALSRQNNPCNATDQTIIPATNTEMQKLYRLAKLSPDRISVHENDIKDSCLELSRSLLQKKEINPYDYLSASLVIAEGIVVDIFNYAQRLGLYPNGFPA
jgi:hypothetical protein